MPTSPVLINKCNNKKIKLLLWLHIHLQRRIFHLNIKFLSKLKKIIKKLFKKITATDQNVSKGRDNNFQMKKL